MISVGLPIYDGDTYLGGLIADQKLQKIQGMLNDISPTPSGYSMLLSGTGCILSAPSRAYASLFDVEANFTTNDQWMCLYDTPQLNFSQVL